MLLNLSIRNIALIDSIDIAFSEGFCVFTGETGAGKSILLDALGLTLGKRAVARLVRHGERQGTVTAEFNISKIVAAREILEEQGVPIHDTLLLRRVVYDDGRSKAFANDEPISVSLLQKIAENLVEIHGQHDQRGLLNPTTHRSVLDAYGGQEKAVGRMANLYHEWKTTLVEYEKNREQAEKVKRDEDYLRHVLAELRELKPYRGEEEELAAKRALMMNSEKAFTALTSALQEVSSKVNVTEALRNAERILTRSTAYTGDTFSQAIEALDKAASEASEATALLENIAGSMEYSEEALEQSEERLFALRAAARKHNCTVDELPEYTVALEQKLELIESQDSQLSKLAMQVERTREEYLRQAREVSNTRTKAAVRFEKIVTEELAPLKMENSKLKVEIEELEEAQWSVNGIDKVNFLVSTNKGNPFGAINKIASGGELSRFMLALKVVLSGTKSVPTLVFDEIDTGIGGAVADAVGARLARLAGNVQVLCVTHQPQVASYGETHLRVEKASKAGHVTTSIRILDTQERKEEIARMLSGAEISDEARAAAGKLIES